MNLKIPEQMSHQKKKDESSPENITRKRVKNVIQYIQQDRIL